MKPQFFRTRSLIVPLLLVVLASFTTIELSAQGEASNPKYKSYVIIGAFTMENNAARFASQMKEKNLTLTVRKNTYKNLYYVYIYEDFNRDRVKEKVLQIRKNHPELYTTWLYCGDFNGPHHTPEETGIQVVAKNNDVEEVQSDSDPSGVTSYAGAQLKQNQKNTDQNSPDQINSNLPKSNNILASSNNKTALTSESDNEDNNDDVERPVNLEPEEGYYYLYLNTTNSKNMKEVKGKVKIIDPERAKELDEVKSHEVVKLRDPDNGTRRIKLSTHIFGFKEVQHTIDLDEPLTEKTDPFVDVIGDSIIVNFDLHRFKKGDVLIMYNVYFFVDAAIMKPESIYELNSLLDMVKENENLKIKIHGHTNGNSHGKIKHLDLNDKNFFTLKGNHKETMGSAKKLSLFRAYTIQHWLMEQGIPEERMEIKGWGGKQMLYDKHGSQAEQNVRVEIEILED